MTSRQTLLPSASFVQLQIAVNAMDALVIPRMSPPTQYLERLVETMCRIALIGLL